MLPLVLSFIVSAFLPFNFPETGNRRAGINVGGGGVGGGHCVKVNYYPLADWEVFFDLGFLGELVPKLPL